MAYLRIAGVFVVAVSCGKVEKATIDAAPDGPAPATLTVAITGAGHVTSVPPGIDCPGTCTHDFGVGDEVKLTKYAIGTSSFTGWTSGGCTGTADCTLTLTAATSVSAGFTCTGSFELNYSGNPVLFEHPACATTLHFDVRGAGGGLGATSTVSPIGSEAAGGRVLADLTVQPSDMIYVVVGAQGSDATASGPGSGGYNGGGDGSAFQTSQFGGGGGGASDIRLNGMALTDRVIVAGGAGGVASCSGNPVAGGIGGGLTGGNAPSCSGATDTAPTGGTQVAGGTPGSYPGYCTAAPGVLGIGGNGCTPTGGGGGGGGYYGGGGGAWQGGAGGSSYATSTATAVTHTQGYQSGNGQVFISF